MNRRYLIALSLCGGCLPPSPAFQEAPRGAYEFHPMGHSASGPLIESLHGTAFVYDDRIRLVITSGFARLTSSQSRRPIGWSAGLAFCHTEGRAAGKWDFRLETRATPIRSIKARGDTLTDTLEFVLEGVRGLDLAAHWLAIQQHSQVSLRSDGAWYEATRPIHGGPFMFSSDSTQRASQHARCNEDH